MSRWSQYLQDTAIGTGKWSNYFSDEEEEKDQLKPGDFGIGKQLEAAGALPQDEIDTSSFMEDLMNRMVGVESGVASGVTKSLTGPAEVIETVSGEDFGARKIRESLTSELDKQAEEKMGSKRAAQAASLAGDIGLDPAGNVAAAAGGAFLLRKALYGKGPGFAKKGFSNWIKSTFLKGGTTHHGSLIKEGIAGSAASDVVNAQATSVRAMERNVDEYVSGYEKLLKRFRKTHSAAEVSDAEEAATSYIRGETSLSQVPDPLRASVAQIKRKITDNINNQVKVLEATGDDTSLKEALELRNIRQQMRFGDNDSAVLTQKFLENASSIKPLQKSPITKVLNAVEGDTLPDIARGIPNKFESPVVNYLHGVGALHSRTMAVDAATQIRGLAQKEMWDEISGSVSKFLQEPVAPKALKAGYTSDQIPFTIPRMVADDLEYLTSRDEYHRGIFTALTGFSKAAKTIFSIPGAMRNFGGSGLLYIGRGGWNPKSFVDAVGASIGGRISAKDFSKSEQPLRELYVKAVEYGIAEDSLHAGEFLDFVRMASRGGEEASGLLGGFSKGKKWVTNKASQFYQWGDDVWKVAAWMDEMKDLRKALPDASEKEIMSQAARIVRKTMPTYSETAKFVDDLRRNPLIAPFPTFPMEMTRNTINVWQQAITEMHQAATTGNIQFAKMASKRLAGQLAIGLAFQGAGRAFKKVLEDTRENEFDVREANQHAEKLIHHWVADSRSQVIQMDRESGTFLMLDASFSDPYDQFWGIGKALSQALSMGKFDGISHFAQSTLDDFVGLEIFPEALIMAVRGAETRGDEIIPMEPSSGRLASVLGAKDPGSGQKVLAMGETIYKNALEPVTLREFGRAYDEYQENKKKGLAGLDAMPGKTLSGFAGIKTREYKVSKIAQSLSYEFSERKTALTKPLKDALNAGASPQEFFQLMEKQQALYDEQRREYSSLFDDLFYFTRRDSVAANALFEAMSSTGRISKTRARSIIMGESEPLWTRKQMQKYLERANRTFFAGE